MDVFDNSKLLSVDTTIAIPWFLVAIDVKSTMVSCRLHCRQLFTLTAAVSFPHDLFCLGDEVRADG